MDITLLLANTQCIIMLALQLPFPQCCNGDWMIRGKIIRSVLCSIEFNNCAQCNAHTQTDLTVLWIGFCLTGPISLCLD